MCTVTDHNINYFCFIIDTVLPRLYRAVVYNDEPTTGNDEIQLLHYFFGSYFPDVAEYRILVRRYYASQGKFYYITSILFVNKYWPFTSFQSKYYEISTEYWNY